MHTSACLCESHRIRCPTDMNQSRQTYAHPVGHPHHMRRMHQGMVFHPQYAIPVTMMPGNWSYQNMQAVPGFAPHYYGQPQFPPRVSPPTKAKKLLDIRDPNERTTSPPEQTSTETKVTAVQLCTPAAEESTDTSEEPLQGENEVSEREGIAHECTIDDHHKAAVRDLEATVYDRMFIMRIKDLAEKSLPTPRLCSTEEKLIKLGLDMKSMPPVSAAFKKQNRNDYNKPRQHVQNKVAGAGRVRQHGPRVNDQQRPWTPLQRQKPVQPSHKAENAYKVVRDVDKITKTAKDIRGLLNKITPTTMPELTQKFLDFEVYKDDEIRAIVLDIIFDKAVEEPRFCPMYSDLCKAQVDEEKRKDATQSFRSGILTKAQKTFENRQSGIEDLKKELSEASDEKKKELEIKVEELNAKEKRRIRGNIGLIGELFRHGLITPKIISWCLIYLLKRDKESDGKDEDSVECAVKMIASVGKEWPKNKSTDCQGSDSFIEHLKLRAKENKYSARIRFTILDLVELRARNWVPRNSAPTGPKTVQEIHEEAQKEQKNNKMEREKFDQQHRNNRMRNVAGIRRDLRPISENALLKSAWSIVRKNAR